MDSIVFDFAIGIAIGAITELLFLRRTGKKGHPVDRVAVTRPTNKIRKVPISTGTGATKGITIARPLAKPVVQPIVASARPQTAVTYSEPPQSSCPTCGLRAPENLMAEHLLSSPLHRKQAPVALVTHTPRKTTVSPMTIPGLEEDPRESMRNLLQMLVPPRAFGRRHAQRTANPIEQLVQTLD